MARIAYQPTNQFFDSLISHSRIALLGLMALGLAACSGGGGSGVVDENDDETGGDGVSSYTVTPTAGAGGSISPGTAQTINHGGAVEFTLTPETGYRIDAVGGSCGGSLNGSTYTTDAITGNCTIEASFSLNTYTVTPSVTAGSGSISPAAPQTVEHGDTVAFEITPETGYGIDAVDSSCGGSLNDNIYTTDAITGNCTIEASFSLNTYTVTPSVTAGGGSIDPDTEQTIDHGDTVEFTLTPDADYIIDTVGGTCGGSLVNGTYTTSAITADCTVEVRFTLPDPQGLSAVAGDESVSLNWSAVDGATEYCVYVSKTADIHPHVNDSYVTRVCPDSTDTNHTVTDLTNYTHYFFVITAADSNIESAPSNEVLVTPRPPVEPAGRLNDTGIDWCADGSTNNQGCPVDDYPGQDGDHGRDAAARDDTLTKVGAGAVGFDFTKLDASGNDLAAGAGAWSCVRDNHTGLIWEVKTTDDGLRHNNNTYTWYQPDGPNMGVPGTQDDGICTGSDCDTHAFVLAVNAQGLCGASDWRLPTVDELHSITHLGRTSPAIDTGFFPNTPSSRFWSASPYAGHSDGAWYVNFYNGNDGWSYKSGNLRVRLVRGGQ